MCVWTCWELGGDLSWEIPLCVYKIIHVIISEQDSFSTLSVRVCVCVWESILESTHAWDSLTLHFMCLKLQNWVLKCGTVPSFTGTAGNSSAIFFTPNQGKLPVLERKQQPLRRLKIMKISLSGPGVGAFSGWQSPSNQCLTIPLCKLMLSFCPLVSDIPLSEVLKD